MAITYKQSGVDVEAGDALVDWLKESQAGKRFHQDKIVSGIGGFASLFRLDFKKYEKPLLITCTDGVGTKVKLASHFQDYSSVGQDLVAMCVNDLICSGGEPLMFLDYYATGKLDLEAAKSFLAGVRAACDLSHCALVGGETAEMPGVYQLGDFDCAGFAVGVVDEVKMLGPHRVQDSDVVLGVSSNGFHSNGFSLLRKVFSADLDHWKNELLRPTHLYVQLSQALQQAVQLSALAHITGGGIDNIPRVLPEHLAYQYSPWQLPPLFQEVQRRTQLADADLLRTLNCGVGLAVILAKDQVMKAQQVITNLGFQCFEIGRVVPRSAGAQEIIGI